MKRSTYSDPDSFTLFPMVSLLPVLGKIGKLEALTSSLYARYEKVKSLSDATADGAGRTADPALKKHNAEKAMLRQVLDWLELQPEGGTKE